MSWRVNLSYLKGRHAMYQNDYPASKDSLMFAFENCPATAARNKKKILKFLVPIQMNMNTFPAKELLQTYQLPEYLCLAESCMDGNVAKFEENLNTYMDTYVQGGVFMTVERLRHLTLRNLIKKVAVAVQADEDLQTVKGQPQVVNLEIIFALLQEWDSALDMDEVECIIANLIYMGYIKGYLNHEKRFMVLSKADPFPLKSE